MELGGFPLTLLGGSFSALGGFHTPRALSSTHLKTSGDPLQPSGVSPCAALSSPNPQPTETARLCLFPFLTLQPGNSPGKVHLFLLSWGSVCSAACCSVFETSYTFFWGFCLLYDYSQESKLNLLFHLGWKHKSMSTFLSQNKRDTQ